jgi:Integrase core domain
MATLAHFTHRRRPPRLWTKARVRGRGQIDIVWSATCVDTDDKRMHLTLKKEATRPPGFNGLQQQERFDAFVREFNGERPHEALDMKCPAEL